MNPANSTLASRRKERESRGLPDRRPRRNSMECDVESAPLVRDCDVSSVPLARTLVTDKESR